MGVFDWLKKKQIHKASKTGNYGGTPRIVMGAVPPRLVDVSPPEVRDLERKLRAPQLECRKATVSDLGRSKDPRALDILLDIMHGEYDWPAWQPNNLDMDSLKRYAIAALGDNKINVPRVLTALHETISNFEFKEEVCSALARIGDKSSIPVLLDVVNRRWDLCVHRALAILGEEQSLAMFLEKLAKDKENNYDDDYYMFEIVLALGEVNNKATACRLLDYLFSNPAIGQKHRNRWLVFDCERFEIFGSYRHLILRAACADEVRQKESDHGNEGTVVRYSWSLNESQTATTNLCIVDTPITTNLLHHIIKREDVKVLTVDGAEHGAWEYGKLCFKEHRNTAAAELSRRGNPPFDESIYLDPINWMDVRL